MYFNFDHGVESKSYKHIALLIIGMDQHAFAKCSFGQPRYKRLNVGLFVHFLMPIKKAPIKFFIGAFKNKNFNLLLGFRFLSFFFSFNNGVRD